MRILMIVLYAVFILNLSATIINIPADQSSIQAGINIAVDNDTILIQPGTYYENINFNGKNITVTSMFMTTQDTTYISQTVIDGSQPSNPDSSSVVTFCCGEDTTAILCGLTIMNGNAYNGGGIYCYGSNPTFDNLVIVNNTAHRGGGIYISDNEALSCNDVSISGNFAEWSGGGIYFANSITNLNNIIISENSAFMGAGIGCYTDSNVDLENIVFINNNSDNNGGAIYCNNSSINIADSQLTENYAYGWGGGIILLHL